MKLRLKQLHKPALLWDEEIQGRKGIKQPLHLNRRPGHRRLGGHHQLGGQLDDHLIATQPEKHCANK